MGIAEKFLLARSERHLRKYRESAKHLRDDFLRQYQSYIPELERCYAEAAYWHGTGRYHYHHANDSRYEEADSNRIMHVLESILDSGAIARHQDLWVTYNGQLKKTVSVAPTRMHARLYAHIHLREGVWLEYVFGGTRFWIGFFIFLAMLHLRNIFDAHKREFVKLTLLNKDSFKHFRTWGSAVRNLDQFKILPIWRAYDLRSDISGNYAVLFGIKRSAIRSDGVLPFIKDLEIRVEQDINLRNITHIEVPLENMEETKRLLAEKAISLPVIPLEFGELYCSQFSLRKLAHA